MNSPYKVKRLFIDIETALCNVGTFSLWPNSINIDAIFDEWYIICAAYKWQGDKEISLITSNKHNDKQLVKKINSLLDKADEVVYHNGDKFDYKKIQTRALYHGLTPISKPKSVDTLKQAKKHFSFMSNKLDYISKYLGLGRKIHTSMDLWVRVAKGEKKAILEIGNYCAQDVNVLEQVYNKLMPYIDTGYNYNIGNNLGDRCPTCGSDNKSPYSGYNYTAVSRFKRFKCNDCGKRFQSGKSEPYKGIGRPLR